MIYVLETIVWKVKSREVAPDRRQHGVEGVDSAQNLSENFFLPWEICFVSAL